MADSITLSCPSCGEKLEITQDVERFACIHCGQEHRVRRIGGIVTLSPPDNTSSGPEIVQLQKEIEGIQENRAALLKASPCPTIPSPIFAVFFVLGACTTLFFLVRLAGLLDLLSSLNVTAHFLIGMALLAVGAIPLIFWRSWTARWDKITGVKIKSMDGQIATKNAEIDHQKHLATP